MTVERAHCLKCDKEVRPIVDFQPGGRMLDLCPHCQAPVGDIVAPAAPQAAAPALAPAVAPAPARPRPPSAPTTPDMDVVAIIRARANALRIEVAALKAKEAELATLERMLAVADVPAINN